MFFFCFPESSAFRRFHTWLIVSGSDFRINPTLSLGHLAQVLRLVQLLGFGSRRAHQSQQELCVAETIGTNMACIVVAIGENCDDIVRKLVLYVLVVTFKTTL